MRETLESKLVQYLGAVAGDRPWLDPADRSRTAKIPLFLRGKYALFQADLFGRKAFLALEKHPSTDVSPGEYRREAAALKNFLGSDVVLVISALPSYARKSMIQQHVPFIVPGTQMFLPMLMIDLREHYPKRREGLEDTLSSVAQVIVLYHLVQEPLNNVPVGQIATRLGYSATAIGNADDELQHTGICDVVREGKTLSLHFKASKRDVWQTAEHLLSTPVKRTQWIRWGRPRPEMRLAGLSALSTYTMLAEDSSPTYAIRDKHLLDALERGQLIGCASRDDAEARIESWRYDPSVLTRKSAVDPCSLYLSLRHSADERVQKELTSLLNGVLS
jgi:hypothetical protein